ncbi:unnamed protein product [Callosobruchus maculatus]|uniref:Uncharacterized protein n=1 Tax=Callosobruchus maculatus TaxID=64391 RepID=A0A653DSM5_CALMS|nr:unnamed protein product [Callosobruchus maculatus]
METIRGNYIILLKSCKFTSSVLFVSSACLKSICLKHVQLPTITFTMKLKMCCVPGCGDTCS